MRRRRRSGSWVVEAAARRTRQVDSPSERTLLEVVFNRQSITREHLSEQSGYSIDSSGFANALSTLRTLELITGERGAQIQIHDSFKE